MKMYNYEIVESTQTKIVIRDTRQGMSITNCAEDVVKELYDTYGNVEIFYYDTDNDYAQLCHTHGTLTGWGFS
jgi:hypothetical protein